MYAMSLGFWLKFKLKPSIFGCECMADILAIFYLINSFDQFV